jgi:A/G-specific adenine glycosylase
MDDICCTGEICDHADQITADLFLQLDLPYCMSEVPAVREVRAEQILKWAHDHGRDLPWRHTRDPWAILVSEVMCQQTQAERVIPKWAAFLEAWPTPNACAAASLGDVLRLWQGLGFPRRAKQLHACAAVLAENEAFPRTLPDLLRLPGVGPYTARAVLAFAFEADVAVVDTNTARVLARWNNKTLNRAEVQASADEELPIGNGWAWNQALLDFGSIVCTRTNPRCSVCCVNDLCVYGQSDASIDPAIGTAGVSVPQSRFGGSDRQLRGRLIKLAASSGFAPVGAASAVGVADQSERVDRLIEQLVSEGLLQRLRDRISLPE